MMSVSLNYKCSGAHNLGSSENSSSQKKVTPQCWNLRTLETKSESSQDPCEWNAWNFILWLTY